MLLCECLSVLAGHCVVWLSDSHSLKVWLFVLNLFATPESVEGDSTCQQSSPPSPPKENTTHFKVNTAM